MCLSTASKTTKRTILSTLAQIFDPLGLIGPTLIKAKIIVQELWKLQLDWDQEIPDYLKQRWDEFLDQIECLNEIKIDRLATIPGSLVFELYGFCDSSEKAYGACIYLAKVNKAGNRELKLLTAKSKVAPAKQVTLPRLELLAAHLLAKLMHRLKFTSDVNVSRIKYF